MNKYTAYCGLDCAACEARIATVRNDGDLRAELAAIQELNKLSGLYSEPVENGESAAVEIARIHLEGTGVVEKGLPLEELARSDGSLLLDAVRWIVTFP